MGEANRSGSSLCGWGEPKQKWLGSVFDIRERAGSGWKLRMGAGRVKGDAGVAWGPAKGGGSWFMADKRQKVSL